MIFAVDVGNTNIVIGVYDENKLIFTSRLATDSSKMEDQYAVVFSQIMNLYDCDPSTIEGAIISSVVPQLIPLLKSSIKKLFGCKACVVSSKLNLNIKISVDNPSALGADLICGAVGAVKKYPLPCIIFDLGTATTVCAIDENGYLLGGSIIPGVGISLKALSSSTAQLPYIKIDEFDGKIIGTNTVDSMRSGIILGTASMLDGMTERYKTILGEECSVIATGGLAPSIVPFCKNEIVVDSNLLIDGLLELYKINVE